MIPHEFVVCGSQAGEIHSVADGLALVWPQVAEESERVWETPRPPFLKPIPDVPVRSGTGRTPPRVVLRD
ncbi:hypothetical protein AB0C19_02135 [Micromonospora sp. NPDC048842]|uniref:hypothetical protein n=1 Tax=Micromonospora sp. NPDC048842 TaxID=3154346 RepID=UPI0033F00076